MTILTPERDPKPSPKRGRSVPAIYGIVSLVLVVGAVTFALSTPPPNTPPLAAVAPAPQEQLEVERVQQSSQFGEGAGGEGDCVPGDPGCQGAPPPGTDDPGGDPVTGQDGHGGQGEPDVVETPAAGELRRCYHSGRTQSPDPQSPPCKAEIFTGDNGGPTWTGVTASTVRVAVPWREQQDEADPAVRSAIKGFARHIEKYYELHGRSLELVFVEASTSTSGAEGRRAWARDVLEVEPFASLEPASGSSGEVAFYRTLSDQGVVSTMGDNTQAAASLPNLLDLPHVWSLFPTSDDALRAAGGVVCDALASRPASHGGDDVRDQTRVFGVLQLAEDGERMNTAPLVSQLEACGAPHATALATKSDNEGIEVALRSLREDGVTTVVCACARLQDNVPQAADRLEWTPEWFVPGTNDHTVTNGTTRGINTVPPDQLRHMFGISAQLRRPLVTAGAERERYEEQYWFTAVRDEVPEIQFGPKTRARTMYSYYGQLLVLASGIQWAGPELTPETFASALAGLRYANPGVGVAPWYQPGVGFGAADRAFNSDYAVFWWDAPESVDDSTWVKNGRMCYVAGGTRFTAGTFPTDLDQRLFDPEEGCR